MMKAIGTGPTFVEMRSRHGRGDVAVRRVAQREGQAAQRDVRDERRCDRA